jgi:glycosyltransferase involved in cell wall biosynthesis
MIENPLVSVIMNCHNGEKYLKESVRSVINQSYKNWEIIFWDNFSSDSSKEVLMQFL